MEEKNKVEVEYEGMSLRHERVENAKLPKINVFYTSDAFDKAQQVCYGIEEEGLPRRMVENDAPFEEALADTVRKGLGVAIGVDCDNALIFSRLFKKSEAFMSYEGIEDEALRIVGKNAARILKHKPFILED